MLIIVRETDALRSLHRKEKLVHTQINGPVESFGDEYGKGVLCSYCVDSRWWTSMFAFR